MVAWQLSSNGVHLEAFQKELQDYWNHHGSTRPNQHMSLSLNGGIAGVRNRVEIELGVEAVKVYEEEMLLFRSNVDENHLFY